MWGKKEAERREKKKNEEYCKKERQEMNEQWNDFSSSVQEVGMYSFHDRKQVERRSGCFSAVDFYLFPCCEFYVFQSQNE